MAAYETTLVTALRGHAGLGALVGTRIHPDKVPQGATLPVVVYQRVHTGREENLQEQVQASGVLFQLSCWGATKAVAVAVAEQLRAALHAMRGSSAYSVLFRNQYGLVDDETGYWREVIDAAVLHDGE